MTVESEVRISLANDRTTAPRRRSFMPRFSIRTLLIAGVIASLLFGWLGRNLYRVRQEDAAIEAILQAGGTIVLRENLPGAPALQERAIRRDDRPEADGIFDQLRRAIGLTVRPPIRLVDIETDAPEDPAAMRALDALRRLPEIEYVSLTGRGIDDAAIPALGPIPGLKHLALYDTSITGEGLAKLPAPERLHTLEAGAVRPDTLSGVPALRELRELHVRDMAVTRSDLEAIATLPKLFHLDLSAVTTIEAGTYASLAGHPTLAMLHAQSMEFGDDDAQTLASLPALETLWIEGAVDEDLATLVKAPRLKTLGLIHTVSRDAARRLSAERPDLTIVHHGTSGLESFRGGESDRDPSEERP